MFRILAAAVLAAPILLGCNNSSPTPRKDENPQPGGGVKVNAPGVKVDVQRNQSDKGRKVNVDVNVDK